MPEKMGGWVKKSTTQFLGTCRSLVAWALLTGQQMFGLGTNLKYYVSTGGDYTDVTPIRRTVTLGADPFSVTATSKTMTVHDVSNGVIVGDFVTFSGATTFGGLTSDQINTEFQITGIIDPDNYTVTLSVPAGSTATGGGAAVSAAYQIHVGLDTTVLGLGWGAGTWGHDTWGSDASAGAGVPIELRLWSAANFGQDLLANVRNGGIYHWDATNPTARMVDITTLVGESDAPSISTWIAISPEEQHVIAFGTNPLGSTDQDPLFVRWSDTESYLDWTPTPTNSAGGYRLSIGTQIVSVKHTRQQFVIFTDQAIYTMTWVGFPFVFNFQLVGTQTNIIGPNASTTVNDQVMWMGQEQFYVYDGRISPLPCPISDYIFTDINLTQSYKIFAFTNALYDEVGWLYPSLASSECDRYVIYNYKENAWYYGSLARTAWLDLGGTYNPLATSPDGYLYAHEFGLDDGSTNPPSPIYSYIESNPMELTIDGPGEHFAFIDRLIPDVAFRNSSATSPSVQMILKTRDYPGADVSQTSNSTVSDAGSGDNRTFTKQCFIRLRGRSATFRIENNTTGVTWRLGEPRINVRPDGRR
jgi:hypothetical protein